LLFTYPQPKEFNMTTFKIHTADTAPEKSRPILKELLGKFGFLPNVVGVLAESPVALKSWVDQKMDLDQGTLSATERKIVHMSASYLNNCGYCMAAGTTIAEKEGVSRDILDALRADKPLKDAKLEQLRQFTKSVLRRMGRPDRTDIDAFRKAGYTDAQLLEVIAGISHATMGNYINHIVEAPLDKAFEPNRFEERKGADMRRSDAA
jgi:uncharacterized peroxidase-related enzyme